MRFALPPRRRGAFGAVDPRRPPPPSGLAASRGGVPVKCVNQRRQRELAPAERIAMLQESGATIKTTR